MMDLNKGAGILKEQFDKLMNDLPPDKRAMVNKSIELMNNATTPEELSKIRDEQIEKARQLESKK